MQNVSQINSISYPLCRRAYSSIKGFGKAISRVFFSIVSAVPGEIRAAKRHFSKNSAIQSLVELFQKATKKEGPLSAPEHHGVALLENSVAKIDPLSLEPKNKKSLWEKYKSLSELKKDPNEWSVSPEELQFLLGSASLSKKDRLIKLLPFLQNFLIQQKKDSPLTKEVFQAFELAILNERDSQSLTDEIFPDIRNKSLQHQAKELMQSIALLSTEKPFIYFGSLSNSIVEKNSFLEKTLKESLPESVYSWIVSDEKKLSESVKSFLIREIDQSGFLDVEDIQKLGGQIETSIRNVLQKASSGLESVLPSSWYDYFISSLKEDLREVAFQNVNKEDFEKRLKSIWQKIEEGGLRKSVEEQLEKTFHTLLSQGKLATDILLNDLLGSLSRDLPVEALKSLSLAGIQMDVQSNFWIEIRKQSNGKYSLHFFSNDSSSEVHESITRENREGRLLPLVFSDIPLEVLNEDFFQRLLSFQVWREHESVNYTLKDVKEGLLDVCLESYQENPKDTNVSPWKNSPRNDLLDWMKIYIHHHSADKKCDFENLFDFDLPYQTLLHFWPNVVKNPDLVKDRKLCHNIKKLLDTISEKSVRLFQEKKFSQERLRTIFATVTEVQKAIAPPSPIKRNFAPSAMIPAELQGSIKGLMDKFGCAPTNVETFKAALRSLLGEEIDEALDLLFEELIPKEDETGEILKTKQESWEEIFGITKLQDLINTVRSMRFSLLHVSRVCGKIATLVEMYFKAAIGAGFIEAILRIFFPHIALYTTLSFRIIARLFGLYGPPILKKILPENIYTPLSAFLGLFSDILSYIKTRISLLVTRFILSRFLGPKQWSQIKNSLHKIQTDLTRKGSLSFEATEKISLESVVNPKEEIEFVELEKIEIKHGFSSFNMETLLPIPDPSPVKPNQIKELVKWVDRVKILNESQPECILPYLNEQLRSLPIPNTTEGQIFWQQVSCPDVVLEYLLTFCLQIKDAQNHYISHEEHAESVVSLFSLYTMVDTLARKCPKSYLSNSYLANGAQLPYFLGSPTFNILNARSYETFLDVAEYFGFERKFRPYTEEEVTKHQEQKGRLFNYETFGNSGRNYGHRKLSFQWTSDKNYFKSLLKSQEIQNKLKKLKQDKKYAELDDNFLLLLDPKTGSSEDERLLPRPFYILRFMDILCRNISLKPHTLPKAKHLEFSLPEEENPCLFHEWVQKPLHKITLNTFKFGQLKTNYSFNLYKSLTDRQDVLNKRGCSEKKKVDPLLDPKQKLHFLYDQNDVLWDCKTKLSQSQIMLNPRCSKCGEGNTEVNRIFQMLRMHRSDQIVRCMALFEDEPQRFTDPVWRSLFDTIVNEMGAIDEQLKIRPEVIQDWGRLFKKWTKKFEAQSDLETILFLSRVANDLLAHCSRYDSKAPSYFPNFAEILERFRPQIQRDEFPQIDKEISNLALCDLHQILCYRHLDPNKANKKEKKEVIFALSRYFFSIESQPTNFDLVSRCRKILYKWHPLIIEFFEKHPKLQHKILNTIASDAGLHPENFEEPWKKTVFNDFYKGDLNVEYIWIKPFKSRFYHRNKKKRPKIDSIQVPLSSSKIDVKQYFENNLRLLNWFEPISEIKLEGNVENERPVLEEISFPRLDLTFKLENIKGQKQAICADGKTPGFYIAKTQFDPQLKAYSRYLLLENEDGKKKVHLLKESMEQLTANFLLKNLANLPSSPLIENSLQHFLENTSSNNEKTIFTYNLNEKGELESNDPEAVAQLAVFHFVNNNMDASFRYFSQLEQIGRLIPFSESVLSLMDTFVLPLLLSPNRKAEELLLRLEAIRSENALIAHKGKIVEERSNKNFLRWIAVQIRYHQYLKRVKQGSHPYLDTEKELFILKSIALFSVGIANNQFGEMINSDSYASKLLKKIGIENLAEHLLMIPSLSSRFHELRKKLGESSPWGEIVRFCSSFLEQNSQTLSGKIYQGIDEGIDRLTFSKYSRKESLISRVLSIAKQVFATKNITLRNRHVLGDFQQIDDEYSFEFLDLTPSNIRKNFLSLYQIAFGEVPTSFKSNNEKKLAFENKRKKLGIYLSMLKGKVKDPLVEALLAVLTSVYNTKMSLIGFKLYSLPTPKELEELLESDIKERSCSFEIRLDFVLDSYKEQSYLKYGFKALFGTTPLINTTKFIAKQLFFRTIGTPLKFLNWATRGWFLFKNCAPFQEKNDKIENSSLKIDFGSRNLPSLPKSLSQALVQRETAIDNVMQGILKAYFKRKKTELEPQEELQVPAYEFEENDELNEVNFNELNQSLRDYYERPLQKKQSHVLRKEKNDKELLEDLKDLQNTVEDRLRQERREMIKFVNYDFKEALSEDELLIEKFRNRKKSKEEAISFEEINRLFILHEEDKLIKRTGMKIQHLEELRKRWYLYHLMSSRWNLLFDQVAKCKGDVRGIAGELSRRRAYGFSRDEKPERLVRSLLVFESNSQKMLWKDQCDQTVKLLMNEKNQKLLELIMAGGKSWFIIPAVSHYGTEGIDKESSEVRKKLMINVWPSALAKTNIEQSAKQGGQIYQQTTNGFNVTRERSWEKSYSWALRHMFRRALEKGEKIDTTKESLQAFQLNLIEQAFNPKDPSEDQESVLDDFVNIGAMIQSNGVFNTDELHEQITPTEELNYPLGPKQTIRDSFVEVFEDCLYETMAYCKDLRKMISSILENPNLISQEEYRKEFAHLLTNSEKLTAEQELIILKDFAENLKVVSLESEKPESLSEQVYRKQILPILGKRLTSLEMFKLNPKERMIFEKYISGNAQRIPDCVALNDKFDQMALVKGFLTVCLPQTLESNIHVDYHQSLKGNGEFARPSKGNINPSEDAIIRNPFEALIKSAFLLLRNRLNIHQMRTLLVFLRTRGIQRAKSQLCSFEATPEAQFFKIHCPDYDLLKFEKDFTEIREKLNKSDRVVLTYFRHFVAKQSEFYGENLSQNSSNFASMCEELLGFTGTDYNKGCYPKGMDILSNPGTNGESVDLLEKKATVELLESESPKDILEELKGWFDRKPKGRAFVDVDAGLNGIETKSVMKSLLEYIEKRDDLDAVAGYIGSQKVIWQKGAPEPVPFDQVRIPPERRLSYYDNAHIFGADIDQMFEAEFSLYYKGGPRFRLFQGLWRARGLKTLNQKPTILTTRKTAANITKTPNKVPTPREIIAFGTKTETEMLRKLNYAADRQEMQDVIRSAILIKAYETGTFEGFRGIISRFPDVFKRKLETDPRRLFGQIDAWAKPEEVFNELRKRLSETAQNAKLFSEKELQVINQRLNALGHGDYPATVHVYKSDKGIYEDILDDMNKSSNVQVSEQNNIKNDQEEKIQLQLEEQVNQLNQKPKTARKPQTFFSWNPNLNPTMLDTWMHLGDNKQGGVPLFSVKDSMAKTGREKIAKYIHPKIWATNNVFHLKTKNSTLVKPFGKYQIPIFKALVVSHSNGCPLIILVDQEESEDFWKGRLKLDKDGRFKSDPFVKMCLYDVHTEMVTAEGSKPFDKELESQEFKEVMVQIKFLSGCVRFDESEQKILKQWLKNDPENMIDYFKKVNNHHGTAPYIGSCVETIFLKLTKKKESYKLQGL